MVALWVNLGTTLNVSLGWLRGRYLAAAAMGAIAGPLAYWAGVRLEAVTFGLPLPVALAVISVEWAVSMPALIGINAALQPRAGRQRDATTTELHPAEAQP
jgi:hypothetical protein